MFVELEVFAAKFSHMHQSFDIHLVERDEDAEGRCRGDDAAVFLSQVLTHVLALEPGLDVAAGLVGTPLVGAAMQSCSLPGKYFLAWCDDCFLRLLRRCLDPRSKPLRQLGMRLARHGQHGQLVPAAPQDRLDHTVHQQVGIAPDRAGEVRVGLVGQTEVAFIHRRVDRLAHRAQQHRVDLLGVGPVLGGIGNRLELGWLRIVGDAEANANGLQVATQHILLFGSGAFVHAVQAGMLALRNEVGTADIRGQHGLFDQTMRFVAGTRHDLFDASRVIANDLRLGGLEVDRTTHTALLEQRPVHVVQVQQIGHAILAPDCFRPARVAQDGGHFGVREARVAEHHRRIELVGVDFASGTHEHVADHAQALDFGVQRTQAVRQFLGQHRDDAAWKVDAGSTVIGVDVDARTRLDIGTHIGNRYKQPPSLATADFCRLAVNRIVEVTCVFTVDGDERNIGQVDAMKLVRCDDLVWQGARLGQASFGKFVRHAIFAYSDLDLHAGIVDLAQHFLDAAHRLSEQCRRFRQLHHDHLAGLGRASRALWNQHILTVALVLRRYQPDAAFVKQPADDRLLGALDDFNHPPLWTTAPVLAHHACLDTVFMKHRTHLVRGQKDVAFAVIALHKTVSIAMSLNGSFKFIQHAAGLAIILDTILSFLKFKTCCTCAACGPRWRNW